MRRRISDRLVDEYVEEAQHRRQDARRSDPAWELVAATDGLGGLVWQRKRDEQPGRAAAPQAEENDSREHHC